MYSFWTRKIKIISCVCYFCSYIIFKISCMYNNPSYRQATNHCRNMTCHQYSKLKNMMTLEQLLLKFIPIKIYVSFVHIYMELAISRWIGRCSTTFSLGKQPDDMWPFLIIKWRRKNQLLLRTKQTMNHQDPQIIQPS